MPLSSKIVGRSAGEKVNLHLAGDIFGHEGLETIVFDPHDFDCAHGRLMTVFHSLQTGVIALLYWEGTDGAHHFIMPIEGRGTLNFDRFDGMQNPRTEGMTGKLLMRVCQYGEPDARRHYFALSFEIFKQRS